MNFKEAHKYAHVFRWIADGEVVEYWSSLNRKWDLLSNNTMVLRNAYIGVDFEFRLAPRTIFVNGVEVPAPESVAPAIGDVVWIADPCGKGYMCYPETWSDHAEQIELLSRKLVHKTKEDAIARAKAMLLTSDK